MSLVSTFPGSSLGLGPAPSPAIHLSPCLAAHNRLAPAIYSSTKAKNAPTTRPISALDRGAPPRITEGVAECVGPLAVVAGGGVDVGPTDGSTDADGAEDPETAAWESWLAHAQTGHGLALMSLSLPTNVGCVVAHQPQRHRARPVTRTDCTTWPCRARRRRAARPSAGTGTQCRSRRSRSSPRRG